MDDSEQPQGAGARPQVVTALMPWFMGGPWVPKFSGGEPPKFVEWRTHIEAFIRAQGLNAEQRVDFLLSALEGNAKREIALLDVGDRGTDTMILEALAKLYEGQQSVAQLRVQFFNGKQEPGEDVGAFTLRLRELHHKWRARDPPGGGSDEELLRTQFAMGLRPGPVKQELQRQLRRRVTTTFNEACGEAKALERELGWSEEAQACPAFVTASKEPATMTPDWQKIKETLRAELRQEITEQVTLLSKSIVEELRGRLQAVPAATPTDAPSLPPWRPQPNNPQRQRLGSAPPGQSYYQWDGQGRAICRGCGETGHIQRFCPRRRPTQPGFQHSRSQQGE